MRCNRLIGQLWGNGRFRYHTLSVFLWLLIFALFAPIISPLFGFNPAAYLHQILQVFLPTPKKPPRLIPQITF